MALGGHASAVRGRCPRPAVGLRRVGGVVVRRRRGERIGGRSGGRGEASVHGHPLWAGATLADPRCTEAGRPPVCGTPRSVAETRARTF